MDIKSIADNVFLENGIWFSKNISEVSYPKTGNMNCYEIEQDSFWFKHRNNCIIESVKQYSPNDVFFDVGGGNGYVAKGLEDNDIQSVLIEPGVEGALNAKNRGLKNVICSTFEGAGIQKNTCKAIGLFDVVEHIKDDQLFIKSIHSILANEGIVYITVPAFNLLWSEDDTKAGHFRRYTVESIGNVLKQNGFEILYATYIFSILPIPVFLFRTIPSRFKTSKKPKGFAHYKKEHSQKRGVLTKVLDKIWAKELNRIRNKKKIPVGGSCFIVAKKISVS